MYQPPTDSLYKFCALVGIIIALIAIAYPTKAIFELGAKINAVQRDMAIWEAESNFIIKKSERLKEIIQGTLDLQKKPSLSKNKIIIHYTEDEIKKFEMDLMESHKNFKIGEAKIRFSLAEQDELLSQIKEFKWWGIVVFLDGILLAAYGFWNWYFKIQVHMDAEMRKKSKVDKFFKFRIKKNSTYKI